MEEGHVIQGFEVKGRDSEPVQVSHSLFADDTLIFCGTNSNQIGYLKCTLFCSEADLGKSDGSDRRGSTYI